LCFAGLWTLADREGRLEDRPRRIKAALFPYDVLDVDDLLDRLAGKGFVLRYVADGVAYLAIPTFLAHQRPKTDETLSAIPAPILEQPRGKVSPPRSYNGQRIEGSGQGTEGESADGALLSAADALQEAWNRLTTPPIARCRDLTTKRKRHAKARLTEHPLTEWEAVFSRIQASLFCRGENDRGWVASFDWVIGSPDVALKTLEGKYDNRGNISKAVSMDRTTTTRYTCPHEPPCEQPNWRCHQRTQLEATKRAAS
jgi:hypothetical protein